MQDNIDDNFVKITVIDVVANYYSKYIHDESTNQVKHFLIIFKK